MDLEKKYKECMPVFWATAHAAASVSGIVCNRLFARERIAKVKRLLSKLHEFHRRSFDA
jgi:hypothetical protein